VVLAANTKYWVVGTSTGTFLENGGNGWCGQAGLTATGVGTLPSEAAATYYSGTWYAAEKTQFFAVYGTISTPATLSTFTATPGATQVDLAWSTASEVATSGFNIWRSDAADGTYTKLNAALIPATGVSPAGASYTWSDTSLSYNYAVFYKLEDIDANGLSNLHGPVSATEVTNTLRTFQASPASIFLGGGSTLSWTVIGSPTLTLDGTAVSGTSSWVTPTANKTYSLSDGQSSQTATVSVRTFAFTDMAALSRVWGSVKGDATYNACYDLNGDGKVDDADVDLCFTGF